jgi:hypothetical protein
VKRVVVLKADGLPGWLVDRMLSERDPITGRSPLPSIERIFVQRGVRLRHFYSRGVSLSVPSWAVLDTGQPSPIRGNVEYDRYTLRAFDYLNFIPFYFKSAFSQAADMPGVELLDDLGIPLLADRFDRGQTHQSFQLYQRGIRWDTLKRAARGPFPVLAPRQLFDEWQAGFALSRALEDEIEKALLDALADDRILYLDLFTGDYDHLAHLDNSESAQRGVVSKIDGLVGRVWSAIEKSALADQTLLVLVSDHGMNTRPGTYSQGYNLVELLRGAEGGAHHVVTNRHPLSEYKLRGLFPFVHRVFTASGVSPYGASSPKDYPTALLDLDGNERAGIYLRNSDLNLIHLLLLQLERRDLAPALRRAAEEACRQAIEQFSAATRARLHRLQPHLATLRASINRFASEAGQPGESAQVQRRNKAHARSWRTDASAYRDAIAAIEQLTNAVPLPRRPTASKLVPKRFVGEPNSIHQLQNYVVSVVPGGLQLMPDGSLDQARSFRRINYFELLTGLAVRNVPQPDVGSRPVDFVAVRVPTRALPASLVREDRPESAVWLNGGPHRQLLILSRGHPVVELKVLAVTNLRQHADGGTHFDNPGWRAGLPLELLEDERFAVPASDREQWLSQWHTEREWMRAAHRTRFTSAVIGLFEHFRQGAGRASHEDFHWSRRELVEADLLVVAKEHWNFNVRGFNPGGNHGGFGRLSTHATLLLAGGSGTGVRQGIAVEEPYDSLSLVPTLLGLMGRCDPDLPGELIREVGVMPCDISTEQ